MATSEYRPAARAHRLVVKAVGDEVLVYDLESHRAHRLNPVAAAVWRRCDGTRLVAAIAAGAAEEIGAPVPLAAAWYALRTPGEAHLLTAPVEATALTRRELVRRLGTAAAVALPLVTTVTAPAPAQAASCAGPGDPCSTQEQCCGGLCSTGCACQGGFCALV